MYIFILEEQKKKQQIYWDESLWILLDIYMYTLL